MRWWKALRRKFPTRDEIGASARPFLVGGAAFSLAVTGIIASTENHGGGGCTLSLPAGYAGVSIPASYPNGCNTGVPVGTHLQAYTGPSTISTCGLTSGGSTGIVAGVITGVSMGPINITASNGFHDEQHPCVTINDSLIVGATGTSGNALVKTGFGNTNHGPLVLNYDELHVTDGGTYALMETNWYAHHISVHGSQSLTYCDISCGLFDSYIYNQGNKTASDHLGAYHDTGTGGGVGASVINHNTMICTQTGPEINVPPASGGGCSASLSLIPDPGNQMKNYTVTNNLFLASGTQTFCTQFLLVRTANPGLYGQNLKYANNVWQKGTSGICGSAGPNTSGTSWNTVGLVNDHFCNNTYDDGAHTLISPSDETGGC